MNTFPNNQIIFNILAFDNCHRRGKFAELGFKAQAAALGLPELGESLAIMAHMEDLSVDEAIEQYKRELGQ
jgi:hypothetical protein